MATIGIDIGNYNLKTSSGFIMPAKYTTKERLLDSGTALTHNGTTYYMGEGTLETKLNKAEKQNILPLLYTAILESTDRPVVNIVVGLPINQYKSNKDKLKAAILQNKMIKVRYKGIDRTLIIENVEVFPEGAGAYYSLENKNKKCIILDIGGRTTNFAVFENNKLIKADSKALGMINLYDSIRQHLNSNHTLSLNIEDIESILRDGLKVDGQQVDMNFIAPFIKDMVENLMNELNLNYPIRTHTSILTGGGSFLLYGVLKKKIESLVRIDNYLFANAQGFRKVGLSLWKEED
ncbi:MAG: ParM/StbA family protein [Bacteroidota bacterium]|nr:ParM/StbA family protein [Bacteroidota bacterium]